jgi:hypothetical protein
VCARTNGVSGGIELPLVAGEGEGKISVEEARYILPHFFIKMHHYFAVGPGLGFRV